MFDSLFGNVVEDDVDHDDDHDHTKGGGRSSRSRSRSGGGGILGPDLDESQDHEYDDDDDDDDDDEGHHYYDDDDDELDEEDQEPYWFAAAPTGAPGAAPGAADLSFNSQLPFDEVSPTATKQQQQQQQQRPSAYRSYAADKISFDEDEDRKKKNQKNDDEEGDDDDDDAAAAVPSTSKKTNWSWCCCSCSLLAPFGTPYCRQFTSKLLFVCSAVLWTWMVIDHVFLVDSSGSGSNNSLQFNPVGTQSLSFYTDGEQQQEQIIFQVGIGGGDDGSSSRQQVTTTQAYMFASMLCLLLSGLLESCLINYDNSGKWGGRYLSAFPTALSACCGLASAAVLRFDSDNADDDSSDGMNNDISAYLNVARAHLVLVASFTLMYLLCCVRQSYNKWLQLGGDVCWLLSTMADAASSYFFVLPQLTSQPSTYQPYVDYLIVASAGMWTLSSVFHLTNVTCCRHAALDVDDGDDDDIDSINNDHDDEIHAAMEEGRKRASMEESSVLKGVETDVTQQPTGGSTEEETDDNGGDDDDEISDFYGTRAAAKAERERAKAERDHRRLSKDVASSSSSSAAGKASSTFQQTSTTRQQHHHVFEDDGSADENNGSRRRGGNNKGNNGGDDDDDNSTMAGTVFSYIVYPGRNKERKLDPEKVTRSSLDDIFGRVTRRK